MALSYTKANELLRSLNGQYGTVYIGLSTTTPNRDGTGVSEPPASAGYVRKKLESTAMSTPTAGATANVETVYFAEATASWGTCTYFCLFSAATGGDLVAYGALNPSVAPISGKVPLIRAGYLTMTM